MRSSSCPRIPGKRSRQSISWCVDSVGKEVGLHRLIMTHPTGKCPHPSATDHQVSGGLHPQHPVVALATAPQSTSLSRSSQISSVKIPHAMRLERPTNHGWTRSGQKTSGAYPIESPHLRGGRSIRPPSNPDSLCKDTVSEFFEPEAVRED